MILSLTAVLGALLTTGEAKDLISKTREAGKTFELAGEVVVTERYSFILADDAGQICVWSTHAPKKPVEGDRVTVSCATTPDASDRLSRLAHATAITVSGHQTPPPPVAMTPSSLAGSTAYARVRLTGVLSGVTADEIDPDWTILSVEDADTRVNVWGKWDAPTVARLRDAIDASVEIAGSACPRNTTGLRHYNGPWMNAGKKSDLVILSPPPTDAFSSNRPLPHRQVLSGTVLATWDDDTFFLKADDTPPTEVHLTAGAPLPAVGARVTAAGFVRHNTFFTYLANACVRTDPSAAEGATAAGDLLSASDVLQDRTGKRKINPEANGRLLRLRGRVRDVIGAGTGQARLDLDCDGERAVVLLGPATAPAVGSVVEATGVCRIVCETEAGLNDTIRLTGFSVILRASDDLRILEFPPWWTPLRLLIALGILVLLLVAILFWNASLRVLANRRGREMLRASIGKAEADLRTQERTRLAVELHDTIAQNLTGASFEISTAGRSLDADAPTAREHLERAERTIKSCRDDLRNCIWDLRSHALDLSDMNEAIRQTVLPHVSEARLNVRFSVSRRHLSDNTVHAILKIVRELAINAVRHGRATEIRVAGSTEPGLLKFAVTDNGCGFDPPSAPTAAQGHFGLQGIAERVRRLNGTVSIDSAPGKGCRTVITLRTLQS